MSIAIDRPSPHYPVRLDWLAGHDEPALDPSLEIVDSHHHLWDRAENPYGLHDFVQDAEAGHRIAASVFIECGTRYCEDGPAEFGPVGEVAFAAEAAEDRADARATAACAAIVGHADLTSGRVGEIIDAERRASRDRLRGIRQIAAWHPDPSARASLAAPPRGLLSDERFERGAREIAARKLSLDMFVYHTQLAELADFARRHPNLTLIIDHLGGPIGIGPYASRRDEVFTGWRAGMMALATSPSVHVKLTGLGMRLFGFEFTQRPTPPTSRALADAWGPYVKTCIELFGADRCMFGSNFPVDKGTCSYVVMWNAFKRIAEGASADERASLFANTARRVYRLAS